MVKFLKMHITKSLASIGLFNKDSWTYSSPFAKYSKSNSLVFVQVSIKTAQLAQANPLLWKMHTQKIRKMSSKVAKRAYVIGIFV